MVTRLVVLLTAFAVLPSCVSARSKKAVLASVHATWPQTSLLAETSEFMAKEANSLFWSYIDGVVDQVKFDEWNSYSDAKQYEVAVQIASTVVGAGRVALLKFALSLRAHSPTVQLFQQLGSENRGIECEAYALVHGRVVCSADELRDSVQGAMTRGPAPTLYSVDHVYPVSQEHDVLIVVYGEVGTPKWLVLHNAAKALAVARKARYVLRHWTKEVRDDKLLLSGYGVELAIKNTEYKAVDDSNVPGKAKSDDEDEGDVADYDDINGFNFNVLRKLHPEAKESLVQFRLHLLERDELTPLKVWQVQDLSYQAAQRIASADERDVLSLLTEISQNFPLMARSLSRQTVRKEFRTEVEANQELSLAELGFGEGESALFVNGMSLDVDSFDAFQLLDLLRNEERLADGFHQMGFSADYLSLLVDLDLGEDRFAYALDYREAFPEYLNNLDTDKQYRQWGNSVKLMLQPYFPGMIRPIARNFFTLIFIVDPSKRESRSLLKFAHSFYAHEIPVRLGVVFVVNDDRSVSGLDDASVAMLNLFNFVKVDEGVAKAIREIEKVFESAEDHEPLLAKDVVDYFAKQHSDQDVNDVFGVDSDYDSGRSAGRTFLTNSGLATAPKVLLNGVVLDDAGITVDRFEETVMSEVMKATPKLQKAIIGGKLKERDNVMNWILSQPEVMPRINKRVLNAPVAPNATFLDLTHVKPCTTQRAADFDQLPLVEHTQCIMQTVRYLTRTEDDVPRAVSMWVVADFDTVDGRELAYNTLKHLKHSHTIRVAFINNPKDVEKSSSSGSISRLLSGAVRLLPPSQAKLFATKLVKEEFAAGLLDGSMSLRDVAVNGMDVEKFEAELSELGGEEVLTGRRFASRVLMLDGGDRALIANGMVVGPLKQGEKFEESDVQLLERLVLSRGAKVISEYVSRWMLLSTNTLISDAVARSSALIWSSATKRKRHRLNLQAEEHSVVTLHASVEDGAVIDVVCLMDPLSNAAQRLGSLLTVIQKVVNSRIKLIMNPRGKLSELPLKRFYRLVMEPWISFDASGRILPSTYQARFASLPEKQLLTLTVVPPDSWMVQPIGAFYDLDNIKMENVAGNVIAEFQLENILLEGHCFDEVSGSPPRGLQFTLGTPNEPTRFDTIVMANLGYFQLKATPGAWILKLRAGKSKDIYDIASHTNTESQGVDEVHVLIDSFSGRTIRVRVAKKPGMEEESLLSEGKPTDDDAAQQQSLWTTISSTLSGSETYDTINIFSLASGHLYERFLRIMVLSVMKHTKYPVKFWLLKNYLSPQFKETFPIMAKHYGFEYELVEYKWPRWLHHQTERQRVMWGYKILFLDVLFPLDVKKIIFVDADQIVRTDLMELMELDLGGAPYGFTPFCDSRTSMEGFRFWKKGYWANHLAGRKYHISALYVIDLVKFRQIAAGDRLRGQYQGLSADPNSLSNLDQDLPNNMIHQVRIKSLPQEWLWCETWCDDASKEKAKTIDMCNNPQTKEPKLKAATRICPEWNDYDTEIKAVLAGETSSTVGEEGEKTTVEKERAESERKKDDHGEL